MKINPMIPESKSTLNSTLEQLNAEWLAFQRAHKIIPKPKQPTASDKSSAHQPRFWTDEDHRRAETKRTPITVWRE